MSELTYDEVGATAGELPAGYHHVRQTRVLGRGRPVLDAASTTLLTWQMHERAGVHRVGGESVVTQEQDVAFRWFFIRLECRVISVVHERDQRGFTYGTLARHPECGEERFMIELDADTGTVRATITAFSRPSGRLVRWAGPVPRAVQAFMTRRYLRSLT